MSDSPDAPWLSVVFITTYDYASLRRVVSHMRRQSISDRMEVVIVGVSRDRLKVDEHELTGFAGYQIIEFGKIVRTSEARAAGIRAARAPVFALAEDHCFPGPGWAAALVERHRENWSAVGPVFHNANPNSAMSWTNFLLEYGEWGAPIDGGEPRHLPGHNSSYKRDAVLAFGDELSDRLDSESSMQWEMVRRGHRLYLEPRAQAHHLNPSRLDFSLGLRFKAGRLFAGGRRRDWGWGRRIAFAAAWPLIGLVRLKRTLGIYRRIGGEGPSLARMAPLLVVCVTIDALGEFVGYLLGPGNVAANLADAEFLRERYLNGSDRQRVETFSERLLPAI